MKFVICEKDNKDFYEQEDIFDTIEEAQECIVDNELENYIVRPDFWASVFAEIDNMSNKDIMYIVYDVNSWDGSCESLLWYNMDEFDELTYGMSHWDIARAVYGEDFRANDNYFRWNSYGNFESCDYVNFDKQDKEEIANAIVRIPYDDMPEFAQEIFDEIKEFYDETENE